MRDTRGSYDVSLTTDAHSPPALIRRVCEDRSVFRAVWDASLPGKGSWGEPSVSASAWIYVTEIAMHKFPRSGISALPLCAAVSGLLAMPMANQVGRQTSTPRLVTGSPRTMHSELPRVHLRVGGGQSAELQPVVLDVRGPTVQPHAGGGCE